MRNGRIDEISEEEAMLMTEAEFNGFSDLVECSLAKKFPSAPGFSPVADLKSKKLTRDELKGAIKSLSMYRDVAETFYGHISDWDTSEVTDMSKLFKGVKDFDDDISCWDVSNVTNMRGMFAGALNFNQSIGTWKTGKVVGMRGMFYKA